jgi:putative nucleotidyltransferase with HDIG domain
MTSGQRRSLNLELMPSQLPGTVAFHATRWGLLLGLALLTYLLFPVAGGFETEMLEAGDVASEEIIAPFDFYVAKSDAEIAAEAQRLEGSALPVFDVRTDRVDSVLADTDSLLAALARARSPQERIAVSAQTYGMSLTPEEAEHLDDERSRNEYVRTLKRMLARELGRGVVSAQEAEQLRTRPYIRLRRNGSDMTVVSTDTIRSVPQIIDRRTEYFADPSHDVLITKLLYALAEPTWVANDSAYAAIRAELRATVSPYKDTVRANERIIDANELVSPAAAERLYGLRQQLIERGGESEGRLAGIVGQVLMNALLLAVFWVLLQLYRPMIYENLRQMLLLALLFALVIVGAKVTSEFISAAPELIPIPFAAMLMTAMFRGRVAMVGAMVMAILLGSQAVYSGVESVILALFGGVAAAVSVRNVRRRDHFLLAAAVVAAAYVLAGLALKLRVEASLVEVGYIGIRGGLNAVASAALVSTLLPLFEWIGGVTTDLSLLELSDPDRPLIRRLAIEAPGTYAHSIAMANLCEAACKAVGGHGLLARVGCYYHDVGKVRKPQYFVENQGGGANPHDKLKPEVSAGIVRNHVRDGLQLADEHNLPDVIKAFVAEHHGTMEISYFLDRARNRDGDGEVDAKEFRYPGPKPRSLETAVAMLADGVEAAVRVLDDPDPERLRDVIGHLVKQRVDAGQLEDAPLTMAQLTMVREEFARVLGGTMHNRIDYPATSGGIAADWEARSDA